MISSSDHFAALGLPRTHAISRHELESTYLKLAATHHPDRFVAADEAQKRRATADSGAINRAYAVLRDPVTRAEHLVALLGGWDLERSGEWGPDMAVDQAFLLDLIERREQLAVSVAQLPAVRDEVDAKCEAFLDVALAALDDGDSRAAAKALMKRRYFARLLEEIENLLAEA